MNLDHEKLKALLLSTDSANVALAVELAQSQGDERILDMHAEMQRVHEFWKSIPLDKYPDELSGMFTFFDEKASSSSRTTL